MKHILVIGTLSYLESRRQPVEELLAFVRGAVGTHSKEVTVEVAALDELVHVLEGSDARIVLGENGKDIAEYDFVWLRGRFVPAMNEIAVVAEYLERRGANYANHSYAHRSAYGKNAQMHLLSSLGLMYPKTVFAIGKYAEPAFMKHLSFPMIIKNNHGSHGEKNYLVNNQTDLTAVLRRHPDVAFVAQEYIPNKSDFRILFIGQECLIIERKGTSGSHLNNTSQGGVARLVQPADFPEQVISQAREFSETLHYEISGVDVLFSSETGEHYFLEANSQPQLTSGASVDEKQQLISRYLMAKLGF